MIYKIIRNKQNRDKYIEAKKNGMIGAGEYNQYIETVNIDYNPSWTGVNYDFCSSAWNERLKNENVNTDKCGSDSPMRYNHLIYNIKSKRLNEVIEEYKKVNPENITSKNIDDVKYLIDLLAIENDKRINEARKAEAKLKYISNESDKYNNIKDYII
jgi:hypothetical protein